MSTADQSILRPLVLLADPKTCDAALGRLAAGEIFVELCDDDRNGRAGALEALLCAIREEAGRGETVLRWISNPLRSPLTLERLFLQAVGPEADLRVERSPAELAEFLLRSAAGAARCLLIVQQPETLDAEARDMLARIAPHLGDGPAAIQFLFCGTSGFRPIQPAGRALTVLSLHPSSLAQARPPTRWWRRLLPLLLLVAACFGGTLLLTRTAGLKASPPRAIEPSSAAAGVATDHAPSPALQAAQPPAPAAAVAAPAANAANLVAPALASGSPPASDRATSSTRIDVSTVRREFNAFLAQQSPRIANLDQQQRDALFNEFLLHYRRDDTQQP